MDLEIKDAKKDNITKRLTEAVDNKQLTIEYNGTNLAVISVSLTKSKDDDDTALIIYIVLGTVMGAAFLIAVVVLIIRCHRERSAGMFHIPNEEHLELSGFSRGSKSNLHQGNFYGDLEIESGEHARRNELDEMNGGTDVGHLPEWKNLASVDLSQAGHVEDESTNDNLHLTYGNKNTERENMVDGNDSVISYDNLSISKENERESKIAGSGDRV